MDELLAVRHHNIVVVLSWMHKVIVHVQTIIIVYEFAHCPIKESLTSEEFLQKSRDVLVILLNAQFVKVLLVQNIDSVVVQLEEQFDGLLHSEKASIGDGSNDEWLLWLQSLWRCTVLQQQGL